VRQKAGRIIAAGITKEVTFEPVDGPINNRIDDVYRAKYHGSPYLSPMIGARARSATLKVMPRETNERQAAAERGQARLAGRLPYRQKSTKLADPKVRKFLHRLL
jgi:hypothetical protein